MEVYFQESPVSVGDVETLFMLVTMSSKSAK